MSVLKALDERNLIFDGAMGSLLITAGLKFNESPEMWNIERKEVIQSIHKQYLDAGADAILTNTFGGNRIRLSERGLEDKLNIINSSAVTIANELVNENQFVVGDIGPTGKFLGPIGEMTEKIYFETYHQQAKYLLAAGVDAILIETMSDLREAVEAVKAVRLIDSNIPIITTMTFDKKKKGFFTLMGNTPEECFEKLEKSGANIVGANCTLGSYEMIDLCKESQKLTTLPLIFQPNAGQPKIIDNHVNYPQTAKEFAQDLKIMIEYGANIIGGCCGSTPKFISEIRNLINLEHVS